MCEIKTSNIQTASSSEHPITKSQTRTGRASLFGRLKLGASLVLGGWGLVLFPGPTASAQYAISWSTMDGGGGTSTGGVYRVSGTIGQPDGGGPLTNAQYSVTGGFWALPQAVQTVGAPLLTITPAGAGLATIAWSPAPPGFVLQETVNLALAWTNSPSGATNPITLPAGLPARFYRLIQP